MDSGILIATNTVETVAGISEKKTASVGSIGPSGISSSPLGSPGPALAESGSRIKSVRLQSVMVVDDQPLFREGVRVWLEKQPHLKFCGEADTAQTARKTIRELRPDLVLLSVSVEPEAPAGLVKKLRREFPKLSVLVLIQKDQVLAGEGALRAGAHGLIMKEQNPQDLLVAISTVLRGEVYLNRELTALMLKKAYFGDGKDDLTAKLSNRELQVFGLLGLGHGTREIAAKLSLSRRTVNVHRENIKRKLNLKAASSLVYAAITWVQRRHLAPNEAPAPEAVPA
jgi:DNA-binding NarL/FixJ family response regulator